jgi:hypothetical protein
MSSNATVSGNTVNATTNGYGGGVYSDGYFCTFTMSSNATVSGNTVNATTDGYGGGVYVEYGTFTMSGSATVSGNTASASSSTSTSTYGGGVYVVASGSFTKTGGVIYGAGVGANSNAVKISDTERINRGAAIYVDIDHWRDTTVNAESEQNSMSKSGSTYTGQWTD